MSRCQSSGFGLFTWWMVWMILVMQCVETTSVGPVEAICIEQEATP